MWVLCAVLEIVSGWRYGCGMSFWSKPINDITYADLQQFCLLREREGVVLDYKQEIPNHLHKAVAAFANTIGGALILGVSTDAENRPTWPPVGMDKHSSFTERITQRCTANIYPPILPDIGNLIENDARPGSKLAVIRIDQSHEAPHAIDGGKAVYIRRGDTSDFFDIADIDRIDRMLTIRRTAEASAKRLLTQSNLRFRRLISGPESIFVSWWVCPRFASRPIRSVGSCLIPGVGAMIPGPGGAYGMKNHSMRIPSGTGHTVVSKRTEYNGIGAYGDFFRGRMFSRDDFAGCSISRDAVVQLTREFLTDAQTVCQTGVHLHPGLLAIGIRLARIQGLAVRITEIEESETLFPDEDYEVEINVKFEEFATSNFVRPAESRIMRELMNDIAHALNFKAPSPRL